MSGQNWPHVLNLSNSIIGVTVLAMPFCYKECGILLGTALLFFSTWLTLISCQLLMKAGVTSRKRSYGFLAQYTHGAPGKIAVEVGMIGLQIGTLIAQVVIIGDLGPAIVSKWTGLQNTGHLRTALIVVLCLGVGLPLGLLRNLTAVSRASTLCIMFYSVFVLYVMTLSIPNLRAANWIDKVNLWRTDGMFKCLPIFSFAFGCQTQLFILYDALPEPSLKEIKSIVGTAVNMCTVAYLLVGFFGYIAFCDKDIGGDIITQFSETFVSDLLKVGFVISIAITFPLIIFPCRGSLYTLLFPQKPKHSEDIESRPIIPEIHFKALTVAIVAVAMTTGVLVPNVEFVLAMNGATMGTLICYIFPAIFFLRVMTGATGKNLAQFVLIIGLTIMVLCTYTTLNSQDQMQPEPIVVPKLSTKSSLVDQAALHKPPVDTIHVEKKNIVADEKPPDPPDKKKDEGNKVNDDIRIEPPNPKAPDEKVVDKNESKQDKPEVSKDEAAPLKKKDNNEEKKETKSESKKHKRAMDTEKDKDSEGNLEKKDKAAKSDGKKDKVEDTVKEQKENKDSGTKDITKDTKHEEKELIKELKKQQAEQKKLIEEQKEILHELKQHKQLEHDNKQLLKELNMYEDEQNNGQESNKQQGQAQQQPDPMENQQGIHQQPILANQPPVANKEQPVVANQQQAGVINPHVPVAVNQQKVEMANQPQLLGNAPVNQQQPAQQPLMANQQQPVVPNQQVLVANQNPVIANQPGVANQQLLMANQHQAVVGKNQPMANQQPQLGAVNQQPMLVNQPVIANQEPAVANQQPLVANQQPIVANQQLPVANQQPLVANQQPIVANQQPPVANQQPVVANQQPPVVNQQPLVANQQPVVANQQAIVGNQQPMVANQQPVLGNQQPVMANQPAMVNQQPLMANQPNVNQQQAAALNNQQVIQQQQILVDPNKNVNIQQPGLNNVQKADAKEKVAQKVIDSKDSVQQSQQGVPQQQQSKQGVPQQQPGNVQGNKAVGSPDSSVKRHKRDVSNSENAVKEKHEKDNKDDDTENKKIPHGDEMRRKKLEFIEPQDNLELDVGEALKLLTKHVSPGAQVNGVMRSLKSLRQKSTK